MSGTVPTRYQSTRPLNTTTVLPPHSVIMHPLSCLGGESVWGSSVLSQGHLARGQRSQGLNLVRQQFLDSSIACLGCRRSWLPRATSSRWPEQLVHICFQKGGPLGLLGPHPSFPSEGERWCWRGGSEAGWGSQGLFSLWPLPAPGPGVLAQSEPIGQTLLGLRAQDLLPWSGLTAQHPFKELRYPREGLWTALRLSWQLSSPVLETPGGGRGAAGLQPGSSEAQLLIYKMEQ